ncbi:HAD family hydrolase [Deinococcus psychrotolerans]|uniref:HAD family hydrolase n=1 Tax=Deinococcus psychrotolerans TaxID=2489213 RepID=A0A3G8YGX2_9DEIO|nr:HAD-IC family P-type ATPase [Deinococcus psychrotolerans]AZI44195.1 HAD family hydrolase [Deinococcus psychrotolerans]
MTHTNNRTFSFYPDQQLVGVIDTPQALEQALRVVVALGIPDQDVTVLAGEAGECWLDADGVQHGLLGRFVRWTEDLMEEHTDAQLYAEYLAAGRLVLAVRLPRHSPAYPPLVAAFLGAQAHFIHYFNTGVIEEVTETPETEPPETGPPAKVPGPLLEGSGTSWIWTAARQNWVLLFALLGLLTGAILRFGFGQPDIANLIWLGTLVLGGTPVVYRTVRGMLHGNFATDVVAMLAIVVAVVMGQSFAGLIIVIMQSGGEALEKYSLRRASSSLEKLLARAPRHAHRKTASGIEDIGVEEVHIGDMLVVRPGDLIPVDGVLLAAQAEIDEAALTGEAVSAPKMQGAALLSGSVNTGDAFELRATQLSANSKYAQIVALVQQAQQDKPPLQRLADRYAVWFTPVTLLTAGLGWLITGQADTVLAVLVVATPCPLILAVPVAVISGINRAASFGIIVKGGAAIEQIGRVQAMVFDKTGTLTFGSPSVEQVVPFGGQSGPELLQLAGHAEQLSSHPLAQALTAAAFKASADQGALPQHVREVAGGGVQAEIAGREVAIGSPAFIAGITGQPLPPDALQTDHLTCSRKTEPYENGVSGTLRDDVPGGQHEGKKVHR